MPHDPTEIEAFEPVTIDPAPAVTLYQGVEYRSDRSYTDRNGDVWHYRGVFEGALLWRRDGDPTETSWNITVVADQFGPLTELQAREDVPFLLALVADLKKQVAERDRDLDEVMGERDRMYEVADKLAHAVAPIEVIGEHSSENDPWENALDLITPAAKVTELTIDRDFARRVAVELENENARQAADLEKYVGKEPTAAEEMRHLNRCLSAVHALCDEAEQGARRWENPLPVPEWVQRVRAAASGERPDDPRFQRRIYIDGEGDPWIELPVVPDDGTVYVVPLQEVSVEADPADEIRENTGGLREIGRCA